MTPPQNKILSLRLSEETLKEAAELIPVIQADPRYSITRITRAAVLKLAVVVGLSILRDEYDPND